MRKEAAGEPWDSWDTREPSLKSEALVGGLIRDPVGQTDGHGQGRVLPWTV